MKLPLHDITGKSSGEFTAPVKVFGEKSNDHVLHTTLVWFQASQRRGSQSTLTRGEVSGSGKKPWKQKGTGRARVGSIRSPLWRKGGVVFAPKPRSYNYSLPVKIRRLALRVALSEMAKIERVRIVDEFNTTEPKTKQGMAFLAALQVSGKVLVILEKENEIFSRSCRNIKGVTLTLAKNLNIFDLLHADWVVAEKKAVTKLEEALV